MTEPTETEIETDGEETSSEAAITRAQYHAVLLTPVTPVGTREHRILSIPRKYTLRTLIAEKFSDHEVVALFKGRHVPHGIQKLVTF